jgi:hypothetical protein
MPPLYGADLRLRRAGLQLRQLKRQVARFQEAHIGYFGTVAGPDGVPLFGLTKMDQDRLAGLSIRAGEIVYNLRSALNYSVFELSRDRNTGKGQRWAQFPIETREEMWHTRVTGLGANSQRRPRQWWLKGVPRPAVDAIKAMQPPPVGGSEWTKDLQDLSNLDKHMHLLGLRSNVQVRITGQEVEVDPDTGQESTVLYFDAEVDDVAFPDGRILNDTLDRLYVAVADAVRLLKTYVGPAEDEQ